MGDDDSGIEAVRRVRKEISRTHDNDPRRLVKYYEALQKRHRDRLIDGACQQADAADAASASRRKSQGRR